MNIPKKDYPIFIIVVFNMFGFLFWALFYSFFHGYIRHFMFDILGAPFYPRVLIMFLLYFCLTTPVSLAIYFISKQFYRYKNSSNGNHL